MKTIILLSIAMVFYNTLEAQRKDRRRFRDEPEKNVDMLKKIRKRHIQYVSKHIGVSGKDSIAFWKVADPYWKEKKKNQKELHEILLSINAKSDDQLEETFNNFLSLKKQTSLIDEKYIEEFKKVITLRQIAIFFQTQRMFKRQILHRHFGSSRINRGRYGPDER